MLRSLVGSEMCIRDRFNGGYRQVPESNVELRRPFCGMTSSRTEKCSPLQESIRLMHQQRRNAGHFTPEQLEKEVLGESITLPVNPTGMFSAPCSHKVSYSKRDPNNPIKRSVMVGNVSRKYAPHHSTSHYPSYSAAACPADSPRLGLDARSLQARCYGGMWDAPRWDNTRCGRRAPPPTADPDDRAWFRG
eukprot:TRINITY_DN15471_c0_g1_i10.p1 TRINITY_DN15471_c0_g1~~TRINITY_DN15471_c0_g1_i10.p1  ORF type:complete len:191 (+),score=43.28 TRINITY_DN15471_c0_g1_i10:149-721(+)